MLRARLLGALDVELNGTAIESPASQRPWALFAYLALEDRPVPRAELAARFWPDVLDQSARASLRSALWSLRRQIGDALAVDGDHVELRNLAWVDVRDGDIRELCCGELLEGVEDEWALQARERHRERVVELLEQQAQAAEPQAAISLTRLQTERAPFDERAHSRLMERLAAAGDRAGAIRAYFALAERLRRELGVAPSPATRELADRLRVDAPAPTSAPQPPSGRLALVGRERELGRLAREWRSATVGRGSVALVRGEAGIGKTRLASELRARAAQSGAATATCAALDLGGAAPLSLWAELIRELLPTLPAPPADAAWPDDLAALVSELPGHFGRSGAPRSAVVPELQRTRLFEAVIALLGWASRDTPLLVLFEDAHDADPLSLELAGYVARRLTKLPVLLLITRRDLPVSTDADRLEQALRARGLIGCELTLGPLAPEAVAALAREVARLGDADVAQVVERAEGNALLAVETARVIHEQVAPSLRSSVRATLGPLAREVRGLLEIAAVAGRPLELSEVERLTPDDAAGEALQTGLLQIVDGRISFRHALLREAAYEETAEPRRRTLHREWARALPPGAESARHLRLAGADLEAVPQLVQAAADARAVAALEPAASYLVEALAISPDRADAWLELGELEAWRGRREASEEAFSQALALLEDGDRLVLARAWLTRGRAHHGALCVPSAVLESSREAIQLLAGVEADSERSEALAAGAWAEAVAGSVDEAERLLLELSATGESTGDRRVYDAGHARAHVLMRRGQFTESYGPFIASGRAALRAGRPDLAYGCWANAAGAAAAAGEPHRALEFLDRGLEGVAGHGLQSIEVQLVAARSFVLRRLGDFDGARAAIDRELALAEQLDQPALRAMAEHDCGMLALDCGQFEQAADLLASALVEGARISRPLTRLALGEALARCGEPDAAADQVRATVLEPLRPSDFPDSLVPRLARVQGLIALARGDRADAQRRLEESIAGWERLVERAVKADTIASVLADLGRPVVGLVEPERELARARSDLEAIKKGSRNAFVS
ncbi:MAG TPA: AAA family ATPase [Solirubrobacteraceae bacterium]|nr:AAA family ATPase [Solirubrobacteraceae bacterium]